MATTLKPVIYLKVAGKKFHWAQSIDSPDSRILSLTFSDTDGKQKPHHKKKGLRDELRFTIVNYDPDKTFGKLFISDTKMFRVGTLVTFQYGFEGDFKLSPERLFKIVVVNDHYSKNEIEQMEVICHDLSRDMNLAKDDFMRPRAAKDNKKHDKNYKLSDVIKEVCAESKLKPHISPEFDTNERPGWMQKKESNIQFLQRIAVDYGADVYVEGSTLFFVSKKEVLRKKPWGLLFRGGLQEYEERLQRSTRVVLVLDFKINIDVEKAAAALESGEMEDKKPEPQKEESKTTNHVLVNESTVQKKGIITRLLGTPDKRKPNVGGTTNADTKKKLSAEQQLRNEDAIKAHATCLGHPALRAKELITLVGRVADKWKINWYIQEMKIHVTNKGGFLMDLSLEMPAALEVVDKNSKAAIDQKKVTLYRRINKSTAQARDAGPHAHQSPRSDAPVKNPPKAGS